MRLNPSSRPDFGDRQARTRPTKTRRSPGAFFFHSPFAVMFLHASLPAVHETHSTAREDQRRPERFTQRLTLTSHGSEWKGKRLLLRVFLLPDVERCAAHQRNNDFYLNAQECSRSPRGPKAVLVRTTLQTSKQTQAIIIFINMILNAQNTKRYIFLQKNIFKQIMFIYFLLK